MDNVKIAGFDTALKAQNSSLRMSNMFLSNNRVGLELDNSPSLIHQSYIAGNKIDILANNTPLEIIDSIVFNIITKGINSLPKNNISINTTKLEAQANEVLRTKDGRTKRARFKSLMYNLSTIAKYAVQAYSMIKTAWDIGMGFSSGNFGL